MGSSLCRFLAFAILKRTSTEKSEISARETRVTEKRRLGAYEIMDFLMELQEDMEYMM